LVVFEAIKVVRAGGDLAEATFIVRANLYASAAALVRAWIAEIAEIFHLAVAVVEAFALAPARRIAIGNATAITAKLTLQAFALVFANIAEATTAVHAEFVRVRVAIFVAGASSSAVFAVVVVNVIVVND
jgi:hypothetical protein